MPVSLISGLAGSTGTIQDPGGLQAFADHLQRAKESQKQDAVKQLDMIFALMKDTGGQWQPQEGLVDKLMRQGGFPKGFLAAATGRPAGTPGPAGKPSAPGAYGLESVPGTAGGGPIPSMPGAPLGAPGLAPVQGPASTEAEAPPMSALEAVGSALRQKEAAATELGQAQLAQARAGTAASEQQTALSRQTMAFAAANQKHVETVQAAESRIGAMAYPATPEGRNQQLADARIVALEKNLSPELKRHLEMTPDEEQEFNQQLAADARMTHSKAQISLAEQLGDMRIQDPKTKTMRELKPDEINGILSGKAVPVGLVSNEKQQEMAFKAMEAQANAKRADASMIEASAYGRLSEQQSKKYEAETELDLAKAKALHDKGIVTNYEDLMKAFDAVEKMKRSGQPLDKTLVKHLEDELARFYGGTPVETKGFIDRWMNRGYTFGGAPVVSEGALQGVTMPGAPPGYELGRAVPALATGAITGVGKATEESGAFLEQFIRGILNTPGQSWGGVTLPREFVGPLAPGQMRQR